MLRVIFGLTVLCLVASGCGSGGSNQDPIKSVPSAARSQVAEAQNVDAAKYPTPKSGQSLGDFARQFNNDGPQAVAATSVFTPGESRLAFGLLDQQQHFKYGPSVVYLQKRDGTGPIAGPFAAPADVLVTQPQFRSQQAATEKSPFAAIYESNVKFAAPGIYNALVVSDFDGVRQGTGMAVEVKSKRQDPIPEVGEQAPKVQTDTKGSVKGNVKLLDTRVPQALELSDQSFGDLVGKKPVVLLFATPQLCTSRVCGPVEDEMLQLKQKYGDRVAFVHQEVYKNNNVQQGLRKPLEQFGLRTEPWLFTVKKDGTIAARLEGSIGLNDFESAIKAALQ